MFGMTFKKNLSFQKLFKGPCETIVNAYGSTFIWSHLYFHSLVKLLWTSRGKIFVLEVRRNNVWLCDGSYYLGSQQQYHERESQTYLPLL